MVSDTEMMVGIVIFYIVIGTFLSFYGRYQYNIDTGTTGIKPLPEDPNPLTFVIHIFDYIGFFFRMIFYGVVGLPYLFNVLIFTPITLTVILLIINIIRGR